ncbi:MAG TPA: hypothetical protein VNG12_25960, partial [Acidimicrobiales bacterium]|nr:hypothetical protein [Acidimicrobiales bacterium]
MMSAPALASAACLVAVGLFPGGHLHVPDAAAVRIRPRIGAPPVSYGGSYRTVSASGDCLWSDAPGPDQPILTDDQVATAIGAAVQFSGDTSLPNPYGPPFVGCEWTETANPAVSVFIREQNFTSQSDAAAQYQTQLSDVPAGTFEANLKIDGYDTFLAQYNDGPAMYILVGDRLVSIGIGRNQSAKEWQSPLSAIGSDLVARLTGQPTSPGSGCSSVSGGPGAAAARQLAGDTNIDDWLSLPASILGDPSTAAGFFDALGPTDVQRMLVANLLASNQRHQPIHPEFMQALDHSLDSCLLAEHFLATLVNTPNAQAILNDIYRYLSNDPK